MTERDQIRKDLLRLIRTRLYKWAQDSTDLYEMADLDQLDIMVDIFQVLLSFISSATVSLKLSEDDLIFIIKDALHFAHESERRHKAKQSHTEE